MSKKGKNSELLRRERKRMLKINGCDSRTLGNIGMKSKLSLGAPKTNRPPVGVPLSLEVRVYLASICNPPVGNSVSSLHESFLTGPGEGGEVAVDIWED